MLTFLFFREVVRPQLDSQSGLTDRNTTISKVVPVHTQTMLTALRATRDPQKIE